MVEVLAAQLDDLQRSDVRSRRTPVLLGNGAADGALRESRNALTAVAGGEFGRAVSRTFDPVRARERSVVRVVTKCLQTRAFRVLPGSAGPGSPLSVPRDETHDPADDAKKTCKCRPFPKRLMGFEPTTFCMASRACSSGSVRKVAGNTGLSS